MGLKTDKPETEELKDDKEANDLKASKTEEEDDVLEESDQGGKDKKDAQGSGGSANHIKIAVPNYKLPSNKISCANYSIWTFIPASMYALFQKMVFIYYLVVLVLQCIPYLSLTGGFPTAVIPLLFVVVLEVFVVAVENLSIWRLDQIENNFKTLLLSGSSITEVSWADIYPGQIIKIRENQIVPADCILLYCNNIVKEVCQVDTIEIDGQTNLSVKTRVNYPEDISNEADLDYLNYYVNSKITFDEPNANITSFRGQLELVGNSIPLSANNLLLRKSVLRQAEYVFAVVIYTGHNTKSMQMQLKTRPKTTKINAKIERLMFVMLMMAVGSSLFGTCYHIIYIFVFQNSMSNFLNYDNFDFLLWFVVTLVRWILLTL